MNHQEAIDAARRAALGSHSPYSHFRVGAVAVSSDGRVFSSANVENAAYPVGQCAEANVINYAVSHGAASFSLVAVACIDATDVDGAYPCGRCRQIMSEFDVQEILVGTATGDTRLHTLDQLLPYRFRL